MRAWGIGDGKEDELLLLFFCFVGLDICLATIGCDGVKTVWLGEFA
jgi:hypothetical protein